MTDDKEKLKIVQEFIYSEDVQDNLKEINNLLLPVNVLEIAGMGRQEIKHSNVLAWMFGDNQHQLGYEILASFLGKVASLDGDNVDNEYLKSLRHYAHFPQHERNIHIKREYTIRLKNGKNKSRTKCMIDLLIIDEVNKVCIVIENKVLSQESDYQLSNYKQAIKEEYQGKQEHIYFIYLTPDGATPNESDEDNESEEKWLIADYQTIYGILEKVLKSESHDIPDKARMIVESYTDLLIKEAIVSNEELKDLCSKIWRNRAYKEALDVLIANRPDNRQEVYNKIREYLNDKFSPDFITNPTKYNIFKFKTKAIQELVDKPNTSDKFYPAHYHLEILNGGLYLKFFTHYLDKNIKDRLWKNEKCRLKEGKSSATLLDMKVEDWSDLLENPDADLSGLTDKEGVKEVIEAIEECDKSLS